MANFNFDISLTGNVGGYDFDSQYVDYVLGKKKDQKVCVMIDSLGGNLSTGLSISGAFALHGDVSVVLRGMNASAATIASLGAKHIAMEKNALYLIHKVSAMIFEWDFMNEDEVKEHITKLEKEAQNLAKLDAAIAKMYAEKTHKSKEEILELMNKELWLSATEALEYGFVDEIVDSNSGEVVITNSMEHALNVAGIPIPSHAKHEDGFLNLFVNMILGCVNKKQKEAHQQQMNAADGSDELQKIIDTLKNEKDFSEKRIQELTNQVAELTKERDQLKADIETLNKRPAEGGQNIIEDGKKEEEKNDSFAEVYKRALELSKRI